ncbi:MAG: F0F1 ATP synthase subunit gamma [Alphaproteobacteria bacterium]|nr:F0F1 ATP synthase subunit gamma [Alphaproteobacteria bacterium]
MPSLRSYRDRIKSVKSTRKITAAMKLVAASKLRRAQEHAQAAQPYAQAMAAMMARLAANVTIGPGTSKLLAGTGSEQKHLLVVVSADRGLCGGFNANVIREARRMIIELKRAGKDVKLVCVGRKARDLLARDFKSLILQSYTDILGKNRVDYAHAQSVTDFILQEFQDGGFDICTLIYNDFRSVLVQKPGRHQIIPFVLPRNDNQPQNTAPVSPYDFEPDEDAILNALLPRNLAVQIYRALLDSAAGEQAARMTAMDNATRNAGDMIKRVSLQYNRARQAFITKELIEIISGAEAL